MKKLEPIVLQEGVSSEDIAALIKLLDCEDKGAVS